MTVFTARVAILALAIVFAVCYQWFVTLDATSPPIPRSTISASGHPDDGFRATDDEGNSSSVTQTCVCEAMDVAEAPSLRDGCARRFIIRCVDHNGRHVAVRRSRSRALVLYSMAQLSLAQSNNLYYFQQFGIFGPGEPTRLFGGVDYILHRPREAIRSAMWCADEERPSNVRVAWVPRSNCSTCEHVRVMADLLGGWRGVAQRYEYVVMLDANLRGPFQHPEDPPWIDVVAMAGTSRLLTLADLRTAVVYHAVTTQHGEIVARPGWLGVPRGLLDAVVPAVAASCAADSLDPRWLAHALASKRPPACLHSLASGATLVCSRNASDLRLYQRAVLHELDYCAEEADPCATVFLHRGECRGRRPSARALAEYHDASLAQVRSNATDRGARAFSEALRSDRCLILAGQLSNLPNAGNGSAHRSLQLDDQSYARQGTARYATWSRRQPNKTDLWRWSDAIRDAAVRGKRVPVCWQRREHDVEPVHWHPPVDAHRNTTCPPRPSIRCSRRVGRALVLYMLPSALRDSDMAEFTNLHFFLDYGVFGPTERTELFEGVDYVFHRMSKDVQQATLVRSKDNVRLVYVPVGPCDLCAHARVLHMLFGANPAHSWKTPYSYFVLMNAGTRGPFQHAADPHWIDVVAMSGRSRVGDLQHEQLVTSVFLCGMHGHHPQSYMLGFTAPVLAVSAGRFSEGCKAFAHASLHEKFICSLWAEVPLGDDL